MDANWRCFRREEEISGEANRSFHAAVDRQRCRVDTAQSPGVAEYARESRDTSKSSAKKRSPESGFHARALGFSIFTEADSLDQLKTMIRDAFIVRSPLSLRCTSLERRIRVDLRNFMDDRDARFPAPYGGHRPTQK